MRAKVVLSMSKNFFLIAGPCVIEDAETMHHIARTVQQICQELAIPYIFKASYKKANRTNLNSFTGIGMSEGLQLLRDIGQTYALQTLTDIHSEAEVAIARDFVDILQIPAFLSRQTDLLFSAGASGKIINIKKGQFASADSMAFALAKARHTGATTVWLTERGNSFGYNDLVVDFRNIPIMQNLGVPVVVDCTHSVQRPNQNSGITGGTPQYISTIAQCAIACGADGIFIETHPEPAKAKSDGTNMLPLAELPKLLSKLCKIYQALH